MKKNKNTMVDLLLLGLTIALMILFDVVFYPADINVTSGISNASAKQAKSDSWFYTQEIGHYAETSRKHYQIVPLIKEALRYQKAGDFNSALEACNNAIVIDTTNAKGYYLRALIYTLLNRKAEAVKDYNKSLRLKPDLFQAYLNRGVLNFKENKYMNAFLDITNAVKINPGESFSFLISQSVKGVF